MEISAKLNYLRIAPRKVRAVAELLKGLDVDAAKAQLRYLPGKPAVSLEKLLNSAIANAKNNFGLNENYLYIREIIVNEGPKLKRYKPKGFGLAMPIHKKTSHIKIILDEIPEAEKKKRDELLAKRPKREILTKKEKEEKRKEAKIEVKPKPEKDIIKGAKRGAFGGLKTFGRKLFRRKAL